MSKKFSIMTIIDLNKLDNEINEYIRLTSNDDPYIFMNQDTVDAIEDEFRLKFGMPIKDIDINNLNAKLKNGTKAEYCGYKVFINNDLKFGIVEIR